MEDVLAGREGGEVEATPAVQAGAAEEAEGGTGFVFPIGPQTRRADCEGEAGGVWG